MPQQPEGNMELPDYTDVLRESEKILRKCFKEFQLDEVFLSFNGGKDCTALLDLTISILQDMYQQNDIARNLKVVYIRTNGPFKEIEQFVTEVETHYGVQLTVMEGDMRDTLQSILSQDGRLKACLMGTRRTDPYSSDLDFMQKTDAGWPQVMRVSPLLNWSYHQIWAYILKKNVPYCSLYDIGYTSIGSIHNTWPNPSLAYKSNNGCICYRPAWYLADGSLERAGRGPRPQGSNGHLIDIISDDSQNGDVL
ncbi:FAD synthase isoform X2 [Pectinophora gossypiella]|uniref:FAD synthase isoform X2 n=1 Tax=Pectinophora gossypiella TaxID=13191 RepID=UPI00214E518F|nr:FAD synthase isoform X2 [Pectinophora gossypiella]